MTRTEIITQWRKMMADEVGQKDSDRMWDRIEAEQLFAEACDALCEETRYFVGAMVDAVCLLPLVISERHYKLHAAVISVESVRPSWKSSPLNKSDVSAMDAYTPAWLTANGRPTDWLLDYEPGYLTLSHTPTAAGDSIRLTVVRRQVANTAETLEIPERWHKHLKFFMGYQALFKQDSEIAGATKQSDFKAIWDIAVEQMKRDILKMRRSSINVSFVGG